MSLLGNLKAAGIRYLSKLQLLLTLCGHFALEVCVCPWPVKWGADPSAVYVWCISGCDCMSPISPPPETLQQGEMNAPFYRWRTRGLGSLCSVPNILQVVSGKDRFEPQAG